MKTKFKIGFYSVPGICLLVLLSNPLFAQKKVWSLKDCLDLAYHYNVSLNQQRLTTRVSKINYEQAKANVLPTLNFSDAQSFSFGNVAYTSGSQVVRTNSTTNDASLNAGYTLYNGFKLKNLIREYKAYAEASELDIEKQKNDLTLNITAAYMQVLYQYDAITIAQHVVEADSAQVVKTAKFVSVGQLAESNLIQIRAQLSADKVAIVNAENQLQLAKVTLMQLMEKPVTAVFDVERPPSVDMPETTLISPETVYQKAEDILPEIKSASLKTRAVEADLEVSRASVLPVLTLNGSLSTEYFSNLKRNSYTTTYQNQTIGYLQSNQGETVTGSVPLTSTTTRNYPFFSQFRDNFSQVVGVNLSIPLFNNYRGINTIRIARIAVENAKLNEQAVKNQLRKNVELAVTDRDAALKNYHATIDQLDYETRAYADMEKKYSVGLASTTDLLVEKTNFYKVSLASLQAKYEFIFKSKVVDFYNGIPISQ